jgi:PEP-CTERM motif
MKIYLVASAAAVAMLTMATAARADDLASFWDVNPNSNVSLTDDPTSGAYPYNWAPGSTSYATAGGETTGSYDGIDYSIWDNGGPYNYPANVSTVVNFGGEQFDVKAMYTQTVGNTFYVGIVTGFNPAGVTDPYTDDGPVAEVGDLAINPNFSGDNDTAQFGVILPIASAPSSGNTTLVAGGTWDIPLVDVGVPKPPDTVYEDGTGTVVATDAMYSYTDLNTTEGISYPDPGVTNVNQDVYLYEISVPLIDFAQYVPEEVSWGMDCNNDSLQVNVPISDVPEPGSLAVLGFGAAGLLLRRKKTA